MKRLNEKSPSREVALLGRQPKETSTKGCKNDSDWCDLDKGRRGQNDHRRQSGSVFGSYPLRYLQRLIDSALGGQFVPELGIAIAAARHSRQRAQRMFAKVSPVSAAIPKPANSEALPEMPAQSETIVRERARLQTLAQEFRIRRHQGVGTTNTPAQVHAAVTGVGTTNTPTPPG